MSEPADTFYCRTHHTDFYNIPARYLTERQVLLLTMPTKTHKDVSYKLFGAFSCFLAIAIATAVYTTTTSKGHSDVTAEAASEARLIVAITNGFVRTYSEHQATVARGLLPTPATFRADALHRADGWLADNGGSTSVIGLPDREIVKAATDEQMRQQILQLEASPDTEVLESLYLQGSKTIHRSLFPFFASEPACAACHNRLQNLTGNEQWRVGDLMGAQYVDLNIDKQILQLKKSVRLISALVFLTVFAGTYCCLFVYKQFQLSRELKALATTDSMTGCINRREMYTRIDRMTERTNGALLMLDLDRFKSINDSYGHAAGDAVIIDFSKRIKNALRKDDWAARIGGEEFVVWLPDVSPASALLITERLRKDIESTPLELDDITIAYTVSIGLHIVKNASPSRFELWIKAADDLLYRAKNEGRNRTVFQRDLIA